MIAKEDFEQYWEISYGQPEEIELSEAEEIEIAALYQKIEERRKSANCPFIYVISVPMEMRDEIKMTGQLQIAILKEWISKHDQGLIDGWLKLELDDIQDLINRESHPGA